MHRKAMGLWGLVLLVLTALPAFAERTVTVPLVSTKPEITGSLSDSLWKQGALLTDFVSSSNTTPLQAATSAVLSCDQKNLYVGVKCVEPNMKSLVTRIKEHDNHVFTDDCVEIMVDGNRDHYSFFHVIVNSIGTMEDIWYLGQRVSDTNWESHALVKTGKYEGGWFAEMAIPLKSMGLTAMAGESWGLNICRERYANAEEYSSWNPVPSSFTQPAYFGRLILADLKDKSPIKLQMESWGSLRFEANGGDNVLRAIVQNSEKEKSSIQAVLYQNLGKSWKTVSKRNLVLGSNGSAEINIPYQVKGVPAERFAVTVKDSKTGKVIFHSERGIVKASASPRVWQVKNPLYKELLSDTPAGDRKDGSIYWGHNLLYTLLRPYSQCYGIRYSYEEALQELSKNKLMVIATSSMIPQYKLDDWARKYSFKLLYSPDYRGSISEGAPTIDGLPFFFDPRSKEAYFNDLRANLPKYKDVVWGVYVMDEPWEHTLIPGVKFFSKMKDTYPYIQQVDQEVREKFGYGKYGIPTSVDDTNPYRWIAYHRWTNQQIIDWHRQVRDEIQKMGIPVKIISMDPVAGNKPYSLDQVGPYCDIMTHQLYPRINANRQEFGFVTKLDADLSGKPVWPCTHVEHYAYSTTPDETRELMSQVFRNGGQGFHLYLPDVTNKDLAGDTKYTQIGSPERYNEIMGILKRIRSMNNVKMPSETKTLLLYSEDTYQSAPALDFIYPDTIEYTYDFIGPVAERWFRIVNDNQVENGKADLSKYSVLFLSVGKYERRSAAEKIADWVKNGGILVNCDPEAFTFDRDGSSMQDVRDSLKLPSLDNALSVSKLNVKGNTLFGKDAINNLPVFESAYKVTPASDAQILATFEDGSPAIILTPVGHGKVISFASNPSTEKALDFVGWKQAFIGLCDGLGLKREKIWKFQFPESALKPIAAEKGTCITGNAVRWYLDEPVTSQNRMLGGTYTYSIQPDAITDKSSGAISFSDGKLTDRRKAIAAIPTDRIPGNFTVAWKNSTPADIVFSLKLEAPISRAHFWYSGKLPAVTLLSSNDGKNWVKLASAPAGTVTEDTLDEVLQAGTIKPAKYVKLSFSAREKGETFTLAEVELWSEK